MTENEQQATAESRRGASAGSVTLSIKEVRDLAELCGLIVSRDQSGQDEEETEVTIAPWPEGGVFEDDDSTKKICAHKHIAYFEEYPEEGVMPIGSPNDGTHAPRT